MQTKVFLALCFLCIFMCVSLVGARHTWSEFNREGGSIILFQVPIGVKRYSYFAGGEIGLENQLVVIGLPTNV